MYAGKTRQTADNTFILTVDGDTDFEPHSIQKMLNQLRGNKEVGVVCGRIHPIGDGKLMSSAYLISIYKPGSLKCISCMLQL